jgi:hypothetical protein
MSKNGKTELRVQVAVSPLLKSRPRATIPRAIISSIDTRETVLVRSSRTSGKKSAKRATKKRVRRLKLPKAFRIVPIRLKTKLKKHAHVFGQAGIPPCPPNTVYFGKISIIGVTYCVYIDEEGNDTLIQC